MKTNIYLDSAAISIDEIYVIEIRGSDVYVLMKGLGKIMIRSEELKKELINYFCDGAGSKSPRCLCTRTMMVQLCDLLLIDDGKLFFKGEEPYPVNDPTMIAKVIARGKELEGVGR
jgi:hypothetical protein